MSGKYLEVHRYGSNTGCVVGYDPDRIDPDRIAGAGAFFEDGWLFVDKNVILIDDPDPDY